MLQPLYRPRAVAALVLATAGLWACAPKAPPPAVRAPVSGQIVRAEEVDDLKPVPAILTSYKMAEATARLSGTLASLTVKEGDTVTRGQTIGWVQDTRIAPQTGAYAAATAAARAQAVQAEANLKRVQTLYDKGFYAPAALDQAVATARAAEANVKAAQAQTDASAAQGGQGAILAPDSGKVIAAGIPKGAVVMAGQSIATITSGALLVRIELPEAQGRHLQPGDPVRLESGGREAIGAIVRIYPSVTQGQMTADVSPSGFESLPVGAQVTAYVRLGRRPAVLLPATYVQTRYGLDYVRLVQDDGTVVETTVETAPYDAGHVEILGGLSAGDRVAPYGATS